MVLTERAGTHAGVPPRLSWIIFIFVFYATCEGLWAQANIPSNDLVIERFETQYRFENDGTGRRMQSARIRVLTQAGLNSVGQVYFPYSSQTEDLSIDYFRTVKADGRVIDADPTRAFDVASPVTQVAPTFSDQKFKGLVAPKLEVGDLLQFQVTYIVKTPLKPGDFWVIHFANRALVVKSEVAILDVPAARPLNFNALETAKYQILEKDNRRIYRWEVSNPQPVKPEEGPQAPLFAASTITNWKQVGDWYLGLQSGRAKPAPEIEQLAAKLTAGKSTGREKLNAIYTYVSESIRYVGISFGIGGYQAHAAAEVLRNGYGDCKDKRELLAALLAVSGLEAAPVLVNSERGVIEPTVPMPAQFDHVMAAVSLDGELVWLDPTLEVAPLGMLTATVRGKQALLVQPGASRLVEIPAESPFAEDNVISTTGKLDAMGKLTLDHAVRMRGQFEVLYRQIFRLGNQQGIAAVLKALAQSDAEDTTAEAISNSDPLDLTGPFGFTYKVTKTDFFAPLSTSKEVNVPHPIIETGAWDERLRKAEKARSAPEAAKPPEIEVGGRGKAEETLDLEIDPVFKVQLPLAIHAERPFAVYDSEYILDHGHLHARRTLTIRQGKLSGADWEALASFGKLVDRDLAQTVTLRRTGAVDLMAHADQMSADELNNEAMTLIDEKKNFSLARDLLLKAVAKDPRHKAAWNNLGRACSALQSPDEAEKAFKKQLEINPNDEYAYKNLGWLYFQLKRYDDAVAAYRKHVEINPLDKEAYGYYAWPLVLMGKWDEAAAVYEKDAALNHDRPDVFTAWGHALMKGGRTEEAREQLAHALELDQSPNTLNSVAYELADAGVDLDLAEKHAKEAVDKAAGDLPSPASLDVTPAYTERLQALGAYLDTLGWVYFKKDKLAAAEPYLLAAHGLQLNSVVAEHVARLRARQDRFEEALRYFAYSQMEWGWSGHSDAELEAYLTKKAGGRSELLGRVIAAKATFADQRRVDPSGEPFTYPPEATAAKAAVVEIAALVDAGGNITDFRLLGGDEPFRSAAMSDVRRVHLPALNWPGQELKTIRTIMFHYLPPSLESSEKRVKVMWALGTPGPENVAVVSPDGKHVIHLPKNTTEAIGQEVSDAAGRTPASGASSGIPAPPAYIADLNRGELLLRTGNTQAAIAMFRRAIQSEPDCAKCHRRLAEILMQGGDRSAAIAEYQETVRVEPDNPEDHFMLGVQLEARAATASQSGYHFNPQTRSSRPAIPKKARADYEAALEQYGLAHQLAPQKSTYKEAYERVKGYLKRQ